MPQKLNDLCSLLLDDKVLSLSEAERGILQLLSNRYEGLRVTFLNRWTADYFAKQNARDLMNGLSVKLAQYFENDLRARQLPDCLYIQHDEGSSSYHLKIAENEAALRYGANLEVFLCHSSGDKQAVKVLHANLLAEGFSPWLDEVELMGGQDWDFEIRKAVRMSDIVLVCLSKSSITREGYVQKEIKFALDVADEKPEGIVYIIPVRLEECVLPSRLSRWHCVDLFKPDGFERLVRAVRSKAEQLIRRNTHA